MLLLINGIPYFAEKMATDFSELDPNNRYVYCNTYESIWGKLKFFVLLPFARGVISANGVSDRSRAYDWVLLWKKKLVLYWQGTDVQIAVNHAKAGTIDRRYIDMAGNIGVAPWFVEELKEANVDVKYVPYGYVKHIGNESIYSEFAVLTYIATGAEDFYGWQYIRALALARPDLKITVVGSNGDGLDVPANVDMLGWVDAQKMLDLFRSHAVFVRLTEHDGKAFTVAQALAAGCEVIWTYTYKHCHTIKRVDQEFIDCITTLEIEVKERGMRPNAKYIEHSLTAYDREKVVGNLLTNIHQIVNG